MAQGGKESFEIDVRLRKEGIEDAKSEFASLQSGAIKAGKSIDDAFAQIDAIVGANQSKIKALEAEFARLKESAAKAFSSGNDKQYRKDSGNLQAIREEIALRKQIIAEATKQADELAEIEQKAAKTQASTNKLTQEEKKNADATKSMKAQLREYREELARMEAAGQRGTKAYNDLAHKAGVLADRMGDAQRQIQILSSDEKVFQGVVGGLNAAAGAASALQGAMGLLVGENEDLQRVMLNVQSLMSITMGLQQLEQALNKDSAFRLVIINGLKAKLATITGAYSATLAAETAAAGASAGANATLAASFKAVGAAIKAIPGIGWLIAGITAAVAIFSSLTGKTKEQEDAEKKLEEQNKRLKESYDEFSSNAAKGTAELVQKYNELKKKWIEAHSTLSKKKFIVEQKDAMNELGLKVKDVVSAENVFVRNTGKVIAALQARAKLTALQTLEQKAYENYYKQIADADDQLGKDLYQAEKNVESYKRKKNSLNNNENEIIKNGEVAQYKQSQYDKANSNYAKNLISAEEEKNRALNRVTDERIKVTKALEDANALIGEPTKDKDNTPTKKDTVETVDENAILQKKEEYNKALSKQARDAAFDRRQAEIDGENEGAKKELDQIKLNYDRQIAAIDDKRNEMIEAARKQEEEIWKMQNPNAKKEGKTFSSSAGLTAQQESILTGMANDAASAKSNAEKQVLKRLQDEYATIEQQIEKIHREYSQKRRAMYKDDSMTEYAEGFSNENVQLLNEREKNDLDAINRAFAEKETEYQRWMISLTNLTLDELENALKMAEDELRKMGAQPGADNKKLTMQKAKVAELRERVQSARVDSDPKEASIKRWQKLYKVLNQVNEQFGEIGDSIGGVAGEALKTAAAITTSALQMVDGIQTLVKASSAAMKASATAGAESMKTLEKASVILAIIGAAFQVFTGLMNAFSGSNMDDMNKRIDNLTASNKDLQGSIDELTDEMQKESGANAVEAYNKAIELTKQQEKNASAIMVAEGKKWERGSRSISGQLNDSASFMNMLKQVSSILGKSINSSTAFLSLSAEEIKKIRDTNDSLYYNILAAYRSVENDHTGEGIDEMLNNYISEYASAINELSDTLVESLTTIKIDTLSSDWQDLLTDMDASGKNFSDNFKNYLRSAIANSLIKKEYSKKLEALTEDFSSRMNDGALSAEDSAMLQEKYSKLYNDALAKIKNLYEIAGLDTGTDQSYSSGGVASMTEDTAQELNGRFTQLQISGQQMAQSLQEMQNISIQGLSHLESIARNTQQLYAMNSMLQAIESNTRNI